MGAAQCRDAGSNSARVWAAGKESNGARGPRLSPVVQARNVRRKPGDSMMLPRFSHERDSASPAKPLRVAAIFVCLPRAPEALA